MPAADPARWPVSRPRPRFRSAAQLMRGMAVAVVVAALLVGAVVTLAFVRSTALEDRVVALHAAAVGVAQAQLEAVQAAPVSTAAARPVADVELAGLVEQAGMPPGDVAEAQRADQLLHVALYSPTSTEGLRAQTGQVLADVSGRIAAAQSEADADLAAWRRWQLGLTVAALLAALGLVLWTSVWVRNSLFARFKDMADTASRINSGASDRLDTSVHDPLGGVAVAFNTGVDRQQSLIARLETEVGRSELSREMADALDMAADETAALEAITIALPRIHPEGQAEVHLRDDGDEALVRVISAPSGPMCPVTSIRDCVALRRGATQLFPDPDAINACPHLRHRDLPAPAAKCLPVTFLGKPLGVLHATGAPDSFEPTAGLLAELAALAGGRLGTIRAFAHEQHQARTDPLTGLANRRAFAEETTRVLHRGGVLAMGDLDHFKLVNDTYGHDTGDRALRLFADVLRAVTRRNDPVARWGGEEFAVFLPAATMATAVGVFSRLRDQLAEACTAAPPAFTTSWGLVAADGDPLDLLVQRADAALYRAKEAGRNRWVVCDGQGDDRPVDVDVDAAAAGGGSLDSALEREWKRLHDTVGPAST